MDLFVVERNMGDETALINAVQPQVIARDNTRQLLDFVLSGHTNDDDIVQLLLFIDCHVHLEIKPISVVDARGNAYFSFE